MRRPKSPPDFQSLMHRAMEHRTERLPKIFSAVSGPLAEGRYLHWNDVIRRNPPEGLSHEEYWLGLKLQRKMLHKEIPLRDSTGVPFKHLTVDPMPERLHQIDLGAGGRIQILEPVANRDTRDRYYVGSLIEEAITSSQLEGAATTRQVAKEMIRTGRSPRDRSEQMILNNFVTMRGIGQLKDEALTRDLVFEIHRRITERTLDDPSASGRFRQGSDGPIDVWDHDRDEVLHVPPPPEELEERLEALCDFANGKTPEGFVHPAIRSIIVHFWLAYDHPFVDGNGRTARALFYWSMLRHGFWLFEFISISPLLLKSPSKYGRAFLYTETDDNDLTYFILHQLDVIDRAVQELHAYIDRKSQEIQSIEGELRGVAQLNHRQRALISHALRHPHHRYTIASHRLCHDVVYQTARADLRDLDRRGLLEAAKTGRTWHFTPAEGFEEKLRDL